MFKEILEDKETMSALQRVGIVVLGLLLLIIGLKLGVELGVISTIQKCKEQRPLILRGVEYKCQQKVS